MNKIYTRSAAGTEAWRYVKDYSRHGDIDVYLSGLLGERFREYRRRWRDASGLKKKFNFPLFLVFETMFRCNLQCIMCIHSGRDKQRYAYDARLPIDAFRRMVEEAASYYCPSLTFGGTSEPLLDDNLIDMIDLAKKNGFMDIMLNTNATLLGPEISERLINGGLTRLRVGFDGLTAPVYEAIRVGADFNQVKKNIMNFIKTRDRMGGRLPIVRVSCVHLSLNDHEIKGFIDFWKPVADYVSIQAYRPHEFTEGRLRIRPARKPSSNCVCTQPFERLYVRGNGDVMPCCNVFGPKVGNIFERSLYDIWNSKKMRLLRSALENGGQNDNPECGQCLRYAQNAKDDYNNG